MKHFCRTKTFCEKHCSATRELTIDFTFQGEMGPEGLRGLPGESGNKGAKVRRAVLLYSMCLHCVKTL